MRSKQSLPYDRDAFVQEMAACRDELDPPTWTEFSYTVRLPSPTISRIQSGVVAQPSPETVEKIARHFPHHAVALYKAAGLPLPIYMLEWPEVAETVADKAGMAPNEYTSAVERILRGLTQAV